MELGSNLIRISGIIAVSSLSLTSCKLGETDANPTEYLDSQCWHQEDRFRATILVYALSEDEVAFDFVSDICDPSQYDLGQPRNFLVSYSTSAGQAIAIALNEKRQVLANQISPLPSIDKVSRAVTITAKAESSRLGETLIKIDHINAIKVGDEGRVDQVLKRQLSVDRQ